MKHLLLTTIAAVLLVGCGESQSPEPPTAKAPDISIHDAANHYSGKYKAIEQHLAAGTNVNAKDENGKTPLHFAAFQGHTAIAELLIAKGADLNAKDNQGATPLHGASLFGFGLIVELLIDKGADVNAKNDDGDTPLDLTLQGRYQGVADLLRKHGGKMGEELK